MKFLARFFTRTRVPDPIPVLIPDYHPSGGGAGRETPGSEESAASSRGRETVDVNADGDEASSAATTSSADGESRSALPENPPTDDVCPICFGDFDVPCRASCGHWYCGSCILQYWNFSAALQPCKCPMCSQHIMKLTPEASLHQRREVEICKVLQNIVSYNRLFVGGISGLMLKVFAIPLYIKRMFRDMLNPDRPGIYLHELRVLALLLGILYSFSPLDFLRIGRQNIIDVFDYSAFALSFILYLVGLYLRRRRLRNLRELVGMWVDRD